MHNQSNISRPIKDNFLSVFDSETFVPDRILSFFREFSHEISEFSNNHEINLIDNPSGCQDMLSALSTKCTELLQHQNTDMGTTPVKVSVIVPCYNRADTVQRCIDSIRNQTIKDIEIILVDDGSTDTTRNIIQDYERMDSRVKCILHDVNRGAGHAKNSGLFAASGEYVGFVDSDDYIDPNYFSRLYWAAAAFNTDIAVASIMQHRGDSSYPFHLYDMNLYTTDTVDKPTSDCSVDPESVIGSEFAASSCTKLFRREIVKGHWFCEGVADDLTFTIPLVASAKKIAYCPNVYYHYVTSTESLTTISNFEKKLGIADCFISAVDLLRRANAAGPCIKMFFANCICGTLYNFSNDINMLTEFRRLLGAIDDFDSFFDIEKNKYIPRGLNLQQAHRESFDVQYYYAFLKFFMAGQFDKLNEHISKWGYSAENYQPKVSIVIPVYNGSNFLKTAIDSALAQTYKNIEVIVINDGSNDEGKTENIALGYGDKIRYFYKENGGVATALNYGIDVMEGEYFSWLSHDDAYKPDRVSKLISALSETDDHTTVLYSGYDVVDEGGNFKYSVKPGDEYSSGQLDTPLFAVLRGLLNGCCLLVHRSNFAQAGVFDPSLRTTQDYDLWFRIFRNGKVKYVNEQLVLSRSHPNQDSVRMKSIALKESVELWKKMALSLSDEERTSLDGSPRQFFQSTEVFLRNSTPFEEAADFMMTVLEEYDEKLPLVSIIIPVYNGSDYMKEAIDSSLAQTYRNIEVIVVNDGSGDDGKTDSIAKSYGEKIRYFSKPNGGVATALNMGIENMKGEYFSWLSHDDVYSLDKVRIQMEAILASGNPATIAYCGYEVIDAQSEYVGRMDPLLLYPEERLNISMLPLMRGLVHGCSLLIHKSHFKRVGMFDVQLRSTQDYDLWFKMFRGASLRFIPDFLVKSRVHPEQGTHKIVNHLDEANDLWMGMISELTKDEILEIDGSVLKFYKEETRFLEATPYEKAWKFAKHRYENTASVLRKSKISVIIPFKNRLGWLLESIESVLSQTYKNVEIIVVDDASDVDLAPLHNLVKSDSRIVYLLSEGKGVSAARNTGISRATGAYIAFLDSDDLFCPEKLEIQLNYMIDECLSFSHTSYSRMTVEGHTMEHRDTSHFKGKVFPEVLCGCPVATPAVMAEAELLRKNRFDETISIGEDTCLWIDISYKHEFGAIKTPLVKVRIAETSAFQNKEKQMMGLTNIMSHIARNPSYRVHTDAVGILASYLGRIMGNVETEVPVAAVVAPEQRKRSSFNRLARFGFRGVKRVATGLGLKQRVGRSRIYRKMELSGTLQKLRGY